MTDFHTVNKNNEQMVGYLMTSNHFQRLFISKGSVRMIINDDMGMMWKEVITVCSNMQHADIRIMVFRMEQSYGWLLTLHFQTFSVFTVN
jgi:hypothetical protein